MTKRLLVTKNHSSVVDYNKDTRLNIGTGYLFSTSTIFKLYKEFCKQNPVDNNLNSLIIKIKLGGIDNLSAREVEVVSDMLRYFYYYISKV